VINFFQDQAIGGYQALELPFSETNFNREVIKTNSARSAIKLILSSVGAKKVWLPTYTCDAVLEAATAIGVAIEFYRVDVNFDVDSEIELEEDEYILIVDYFGLCSEAVKRSISRFGHTKTVVDCSQSFFSKPFESLASIYSPRKFFGLPDGGLIYTQDSRIQQPAERDCSSESRMSHLISRLINSPEAAYEEYLKSEKVISELPVQGMSRLTERLLHSLDYGRAKVARSENAKYLHEHLSEYNHLDLIINENVAPVCYPFLPKVKAASKDELIRQRVFIPTYWPEVLRRVKVNSFEWNLVTNGIFLPCDQRYTEDDMKKLVNLLAIK
jgi:hypothetical protein